MFILLDLGTGCGGPTGEHPHHLLTLLHRKKTSACCTPLVIGGGWDASGRGGNLERRGGRGRRWWRRGPSGCRLLLSVSPCWAVDPQTGSSPCCVCSFEPIDFPE